MRTSGQDQQMRISGFDLADSFEKEGVLSGDQRQAQYIRLEIVQQ